jgi:hypothetical protein
MKTSRRRLPTAPEQFLRQTQLGDYRNRAWRKSSRYLKIKLSKRRGLYFSLANLKVEPTGALSLGAILENKDEFSNRKSLRDCERRQC